MIVNPMNVAFSSKITIKLFNKSIKIAITMYVHMRPTIALITFINKKYRGTKGNCSD